jgi:hypothetical protein
MRVSKGRIGFSSGFSVLVCFLVWLVLGDNSPVEEYFLNHVGLPNLIRQLLILPYLALVVVRPSTPLGDDILILTIEFLQWLLVGYFLSRLIFRE